MNDKKLLIVSITIVVLSAIVSSVYVASQPNDLMCKGAVMSESGEELLLTDCYNPHTESDNTYMVKVVFE